MNISIIGTGYVGLVSGVCLAYKGHRVICVDKIQSIVDSINKGIAPIYEAHLERMLIDVVNNNNLKATTDLEHAVMNTQISIIAVGTPFIGDSIDLKYVEDAAYDIGTILKNKKDYHVVCVKSTVIPTTTDTLVLKTLQQSSGKTLGDFGLVMNPEFLKEGEAVEDFLNPDRIVIGAMDEKSFEMLKNVYKDYFDAPILKVNPRTAEMIKYTSNSLLATLVSFSNEIAAISEEVGNIDALKVLEGVSLDRRITPNLEGKIIKPDITKYLKPGRGFGGSCFPKDVKSLIAFSEKQGYTPQILKSVIEVNESQTRRMIIALKSEISGIKDKTIAILGLAFKANTDDVRESPSIKLIGELLKEGGKLICYDPIAIENAKKELANNINIKFVDRYEKALERADAAIIMTDWDVILNIAFDEFKKLMKNPTIVDGCRIFDITKAESHGIRYVGIGYRE